MKKFFIRIVTVTLTLFTFNYFCCIDIDYDYYNIYFTNNSNKGVVLAATVDYPDTMPRFDELYGAEVDFKYRYRKTFLRPGYLPHISVCVHA